MIKILLADDHDLFRCALGSMLQGVKEFEVVGEVGGGEQAYDFCRRNAVDVVLMDMRMPGIGGLEATRRITRAIDGARVIEATRVIALTGSKDALIGHKFIKAGAFGFLTKDVGFEDLVGAIRKVHGGSPYLSNELAQRIALQSARSERSPFDVLTDRELQISLMIADCQKTRAIANCLHVSPKTVNSYRYRIFDKLDISGDVELTWLVLRYGLMEVNTVAS